jgi:hypothetical protein
MRGNLGETALGFVRGFHMSVCKFGGGIGECLPCAMLGVIVS